MGHDPTEEAQEHIQHVAAHGHDSGPKWITAAALTAAFLAAFAAVSSALATKHLTESTLKRIEANDNWNYYQAKSIKTSILDSRLMDYNIVTGGPAATKPVDAVVKQHLDDLKKKVEYNQPAADEKDPEHPKGMEGLQKKADGLEKVSAEHLDTHETYETSATMFHIAIAVVAIAVVARRREFWYMSMVCGVAGMCFFGHAMTIAPKEVAEKAAEATAPVTSAAAPEKKPADKPATEHAPAGAPIETH